MIKKTISRMLSGSRQEKPSITQLKDEYFAQPTNLYDAASQSRHESRHKAINRSGANADTHTSESDYYYIAERARDLDRNNVVVGQAIDRLCANILQQGFEPEPDTGRKSLNELLKSKWAAYASDKEACDVQGEFDFNFLAYMALRESIVAGDTVVLPLKTGQLQMVESHRIRSPHTRGREAAGENVVHGVEMDSNRRRVRYWITKDDIPLNRLALMTEVSPFAVYDSDGNKQLFHVWHPTRSTMT
ncbi:MAG: phage portal protein, partial [Candidatus Tectomicrobia bacterium]|nr:phage portal protein [Candidatus Tectomicrobia bacterium]